jgi:hypothetical protein
MTPNELTTELIVGALHLTLALKQDNYDIAQYFGDIPHFMLHEYKPTDGYDDILDQFLVWATCQTDGMG